MTTTTTPMTKLINVIFVVTQEHTVEFDASKMKDYDSVICEAEKLLPETISNANLIQAYAVDENGDTVETRDY